MSPADVGAARRTLVALLVAPGDDHVTRRLESADGLTTNGDIDLLVIDGRSLGEVDGELVEHCADRGIAWYRPPCQLTPAQTANIALARSVTGGYESLLLSITDAVFPSNLVAVSATAAGSDAGIASVTPWSDGLNPPQLPNADPQRFLRAPDDVDRVSASLEGQFAARGSDVTTMGSACLLPVAAITEVGYFDPLFATARGAEIDWSERARVRGLRNIVALGAFVRDVGASTQTASAESEGNRATGFERDQAILELRAQEDRAHRQRSASDATLDAARDEALRSLVLDGARERGYTIEVSWIPGVETDDAVRFVVSPERRALGMRAVHRGFEAGWDIGAADVVGRLERLTGTRPRGLVLLERGPRADELVAAAQAAGIAVTDGYHYPQRVAP